MRVKIGAFGCPPLMFSQFCQTEVGKYRSRYKPPEEHDDTMKWSWAGDIFSLGVILYEMCSLDSGAQR